MKDRFDRDITYLRISVTDLCNLRCVYCMPAAGIRQADRSDMLPLEDIVEITRAAVDLGIRKIRLTGGEPLIKKNIVYLCEQLAAIPGLTELSMTTNGVLLSKMAQQLKDAGLNRVNISLDTLQADKYAKITRGGALATTLDGLKAALRVGLTPIKINTVLVGGFNDDEIGDFVNLTQEHGIEQRFIELMPIGESAHFPKEAFISGDVVLETVPALMPLPCDNGVARLYRLPTAIGRVGLINPVSHHFCKSCNRIRLTADGKLKPCLHSKEEISLRGLHGEALSSTLALAIKHKPAQHNGLSDGRTSETQRMMHQIGG